MVTVVMTRLPRGARGAHQARGRRPRRRGDAAGPRHGGHQRGAARRPGPGVAASSAAPPAASTCPTSRACSDASGRRARRAVAAAPRSRRSRSLRARHERIRGRCIRGLAGRPALASRVLRERLAITARKACPTKRRASTSALLVSPGRIARADSATSRITRRVRRPHPGRDEPRARVHHIHARTRSL